MDYISLFMNLEFGDLFEDVSIHRQLQGIMRDADFGRELWYIVGGRNPERNADHFSIIPFSDGLQWRYFSVCVNIIQQ